MKSLVKAMLLCKLGGDLMATVLGHSLPTAQAFLWVTHPVILADTTREAPTTAITLKPRQLLGMERL